MEKGLKPLHLGLVFNNNYIAPPSQFALAYIATKDYNSLESIIDGLTREIKKGSIDVRDTPLLEHYCKNLNLSVEKMQKMVKRHGSSQKAVYKSCLLPLNKNSNHILKLTSGEQLISKIDSGRWQTEQKPYDVHIYNPFNIEKMHFIGGMTDHYSFNLEKGHHWSDTSGLKQDKLYLESLSQKAREQFQDIFHLTDKTVAATLIEFDDVLKTQSYNKLKSESTDFFSKSALPFDFSLKYSNNPDELFGRIKYAYEAFLLRNSKPKIIREITGHKTGKLSLADLDMKLLDKKIVSGRMAPLLNSGEVKKGVFLKRRHFPEYSWAVIQALEEYYFTLSRHFEGYSCEFTSNPDFTTTSIVFDHLSNYNGVHKDVKDLSMRIIFDDHFNLPYIIYKNFNLKMGNQEDINQRKMIYGLKTQDPRKKINISKDRQNPRYLKRFKETDWRTGRTAICTIREPNKQILDRAEQISKRIGRGISSYDLKGRYIENMRNFK